MADTFTIKRGDRLPLLRLRCVDAAGAGVPLGTASSVTAYFRANGAASGSPPAFSGPVVPDADQTGSAGWGTYSWAAGDTAVPGTYNVETVATWNGLEQTFPTTGYGTVVVADDLELHTASLADPVEPAAAEPRSGIIRRP